MDERQLAAFFGALRARYYREGQTVYDDGIGFWLGLDNGVAKFSLGNSAGNKITFDGTTLTVLANLILGSGNFIRSGQTAYDNGTGFWLGNDGGTPKFSLGTSAGDKLTWDGSALAIVGALTLSASSISSHTPIAADYTGWSVDPTGVFKYLNLGEFVLLWVDAANTGTSDLGSFAVSILPAAIRPSTTVQVASPPCIDNGVFVPTMAQITSGGTLSMFNMSTTTFTFGNHWTASGTKGWPAGWSILYRTG
jgi:hypothetical protein